MLASSPDGKVTPVELEKEYRQRLDSSELSRNIEILKRISPGAKYYYCDMLKMDSFSDAMDVIFSEHGSIDGLVHFAGIEISHKIEDKTSGEFSAVFAVKASAAVALWKSRIVKPGGFFAFASSVIGKFGNIGQCDYAAASAYLSMFANSISRRGGRAVAADMSAFDSIGMSAKESVHKYLEGCGVEFLHPEEGMQALLDEIVYGKVPEIILSAALGKIDSDHQLFCNSGYTGKADAELPLLPYIPEFTKGHALTAIKNYSLSTDPYLSDHKVRDIPYVPGVIGMEAFAEAVYKMRGIRPACLENVQFQYPIKVFPNRPEPEVLLRATEHPDGICRMSMENIFRATKARAVRHLHFSASFSGSSAESKFYEAEKITFPESVKAEADSMDIYDSFFQGPRLRVLESIISCDKNSVMSCAKIPENYLWEERKDLVFIPLVFEAMFQTCAWINLKYMNMIYLPAAVRKASVFSNDVPDRYYVLAKFSEEKEDGCHVYNAWAFDKDKKLIAELLGHEMTPAREL